eukprot:IDg8474t1
MPKALQSDSDSEFCNQLTDELVKQNGVDHHTISAYNLRANGAVERAKKTLYLVLKKRLQGTMHDWPDHVPWKQLAYNSKMSRMTGCIHFSLMFGRCLNEFEEYGSSETGKLDLQLWHRRYREISEKIYLA